MTEDAATFSDTSGPSLTWEAILETWEKIQALPPAPTAIWFVDRLEQYHRLMRQLWPTSRNWGDTYHDCPVYQISSKTAREELYKLLSRGYVMKDAREIVPFCQPGVWVSMTKGPPERLELEIERNNDGLQYKI